MVMNEPPTTPEELSWALHSWNGYRTVWLGPKGELWHTEPEDDLESLGFSYVATFFRARAEEVTEALDRHPLWHALRSQAQRLATTGPSPESRPSPGLQPAIAVP